jgi:hypothetical protein
MKKLVLFVMVSALLGAGAAWAAPKKSCLEKCEDFVIMCVKQCQKGVMGEGGSGNQSALNKCREACGKGKEKCLKNCSRQKQEEQQ